jgi:hypothetical protein
MNPVSPVRFGKLEISQTTRAALGDSDYLQLLRMKDQFQPMFDRLERLGLDFLVSSYKLDEIDSQRFTVVQRMKLAGEPPVTSPGEPVAIVYISDNRQQNSRSPMRLDEDMLVLQGASPYYIVYSIVHQGIRAAKKLHEGKAHTLKIIERFRDHFVHEFLPKLRTD